MSQATFRIFKLLLEVSAYTLLIWKLGWVAALGVCLLHWAINLEYGVRK